MIKLSDYVIQFIADAGVKDVFMLAGGGSMHLVDSGKVFLLPIPPASFLLER